MTNYQYKRVRGTRKANRLTNSGWEVVGSASAFGVYTLRRPETDTTHNREYRFGIWLWLQAIGIILITLAFFSMVR